MRRRTLLTGPLASPLLLQTFSQTASAENAEEAVYVSVDGIPHSPAQYTRLLMELAGAKAVEQDAFSRGGLVEQLEKRMAAMLGKEMAVWLPTGTLANHLAIRLLAGGKRRVLVQAESHLFNDCGDCAQTLSGLTLVPLAPGKATFTLEEVERAASATRLGRVETPIGAMQIESPVRRRSGERFDFSEMTRIAGWARKQGIGLHLDGARIFIESVYTGRPVHEYTALFDTVYVSMYKYFNAASGAVLAGPKALLGDLYQTRRMFGGSLHQAWPFAAVALHYSDKFEVSLRKARDTAEAVLAILSKDSNFTITRIAEGTNVFNFQVHGVNPPVYRDRLEQAGIVADAPGEMFTMRVNPTWTRLPPAEIVARFRKAMG
jgi:threonine aldolase